MTWLYLLTLTIFTQVLSQSLQPMPPGTTILSNGEINLQYYLTDRKTIIIQLHSDSCHYVGLAYKPTMTNTDMTIANIFKTQDEKGTTTYDLLLGDYWSTGHTKPKPDANQDSRAPVILGFETDGGKYLTVQFERQLNSGDPEDTPLKENEDFKFAVAWSDSLMLEKHKNLIYFSGRLPSIPTTTAPQISPTDNTPSKTTNININSLIDDTSSAYTPDSYAQTHGVCLTIAWYFFADLGAFFIHYRFRTYAYIIHICLMSLCSLITIISGVIMLIKVKGIVSTSSMSNSQRGHLFFGLFTLVTILFQIGIGATLYYVIFKRAIRPFWIKIIKKIHQCLGYIILFFAKINCLIGWYLVDRKIFIAIILWTIAVIGLFLLRKSWNPRLTGTKFTPNNILTSMNNQELHKLISAYTYNSIQLINKQFVVFAEYVWDLEGIGKFHPAGHKIIELVNGRQIDRFIYGIQSLPQETEVVAVPHSLKSIQAMGPPIFRMQTHKQLYNATYVLDESQFIAISKEELAPDFFLFEFKSNKQRLMYSPPQDLSFLGQYYTVIGFGVSRLYSCANCLREDNRERVDKWLRELGYDVDKNRKKKFKRHSQEEIDPNAVSARVLSKVELSGEAIPMLMKCYRKGKFTSKMLDKAHDAIFTVQGQMGRGLALDKVSKGKIVIVLGGTGLIPFLDLFDLIFKTVLIQRHVVTLNEMSETDPIFKGNILKGFNFVVYASFKSIFDFVNIQQMHYIATEKPAMMKVYVRVSNLDEKGRELRTAYKKVLTFTQRKFSIQFVQDNIQTLDNLSMIYVCGPSRMNQEVAQVFKNTGVEPTKIYYV